MRRLIYIVLLLQLTSCYTKQQAIRKFCVQTSTNIDTSWKISGEVIDSNHTATFQIKDSCGIFKQLYDSLINSGKFVVDTSYQKNDSPNKNNAPRATKWAVLYTDSIFTVKFRVAPNGNAQFDVVKHERKIPYQAHANFKTVVTSPCPPPPPLPWWHKWAVYLFYFLVFFAVIILLIVAILFFFRDNKR